MVIQISKPFTSSENLPGHFDSLIIYPNGDVMLEGWSLDKTLEKRPCVKVDNICIPENSCHRFGREDVLALHPDHGKHTGFRFSYRLNKEQISVNEALIQVFWEDALVLEVTQNIHLDNPFKCSWLSQDHKVFHRSDLYAEGPPSTSATQDVLDLFYPITESALDFGCGIGLYIDELEKRGVKCEGIEIDRPDIRNNIPERLKDKIHLYDGKFPLPFEDESFEVTICSEVLEHIPNFEETLAELSRVTRKCIIITVPDNGALDFLANQFLIPFHMLEPTHVNFFNEFSLQDTVRKYFKGSTELFKICPVVSNGYKWFTSLALIAYKN